MSIFMGLTFDQVNEAQSALSKARAIVEMVSKAITADLGHEQGAPYSDSLWAASDSLDVLAKILLLDISEEEAKRGSAEARESTTAGGIQ